MGGAISPLQYAFMACAEAAIPFHRDKDVFDEEVELEELLVGKNFSTVAEHGTCVADFEIQILVECIVLHSCYFKHKRIFCVCVCQT